MRPSFSHCVVNPSRLPPGLAWATTIKLANRAIWSLRSTATSWVRRWALLAYQCSRRTTTGSLPVSLASAPPLRHAGHGCQPRDHGCHHGCPTDVTALLDVIEGEMSCPELQHAFDQGTPSHRIRSSSGMRWTKSCLNSRRARDGSRSAERVSIFSNREQALPAKGFQALRHIRASVVI